MPARVQEYILWPTWVYTSAIGTECSDFVKNCYGESWNSFHEKSWVPVQNHWVPVENRWFYWDIFVGSIHLFDQKLLLDLLLTADNIALSTQNTFLVQIESHKQDTSSKSSLGRSIVLSTLADGGVKYFCALGDFCVRDLGQEIKKSLLSFALYIINYWHIIGHLLCPFLQLFARNSVKMVENALVQTSANANRDIPDSGVKFVSTNRL